MRDLSPGARRVSFLSQIYAGMYAAYCKKDPDMTLPLSALFQPAHLHMRRKSRSKWGEKGILLGEGRHPWQEESPTSSRTQNPSTQTPSLLSSPDTLRDTKTDCIPSPKSHKSTCKHGPNTCSSPYSTRSPRDAFGYFYKSHNSR
jgi:hypothetical protein